MASDAAHRRFAQVDVFGAEPLRGNPVAVVIDGDGLSDEAMRAFARWTNLSETTFLVAPRDTAADYRVRIFTPAGELPFAGHPTLGSAHAWIEAGGVPAAEGFVTQECGIGLVRLHRSGDTLAFAAPPLVRSGPVDDTTTAAVAAALRIGGDEILASQWVDNGPGWLAVELADAARVVALQPDFVAIAGLKVGVFGFHPVGVDVLYEVRGFVPGLGITEDPVTGSLNAGLATWLFETGRVPDSYTVAQGTALSRAGRVRIDREDDVIWVGGTTRTQISGVVSI